MTTRSIRKIKQTVRDYTMLIGEANIRGRSIPTMCDLGIGKLPAIAITEYGHLQIRMICELIALGCLVVHQDIQGAESVRKTWEAEKVMKRLGSLHKNFFPYPAKREADTNPVAFTSLSSGNIMTSRDLVELHGRANDKLHRLSLAKARKATYDADKELALIQQALDQICNLLAHHVITLYDYKHLLYTVVDFDSADPPKSTMYGSAHPQDVLKR